MDSPMENGADDDVIFERLLAHHLSTHDGDNETLSSVVVNTEVIENVQQLARAHRLQRKESELPTLADMLSLSHALLEHATITDAASGAMLGDMDQALQSSLRPILRMNYDVYCTVKEQLSSRIQRYLTASTFLKLPRDAHDCVNGRSLLRYVVDRTQLAHFLWRLAAFDSVGDGALREHDLENYVFETIPSVPDLAGLQVNFFPFYVFTAVRKFFFFLDPQRTGRIRLSDLISSRVAAEWLQLLPPMLAEGDIADDASALLASTSPLPASASNWFTSANALRVYSNYLELDTDQNGMLRRSELTAFRGGTLTDAFLDRVFQEVHTYGGEVDYKAFLDFLLAAEYRASAASMRYIFRLLDLQHTGRLTLFELRYFLRDVAARMAAAGAVDVVDVSNVCDEIMDMVAPATPGVITLEDLKRCRVGHTVLHILTDVAGYYEYDQRESI